MRRTYKLLKDTPELRKGALVQERCDDGTQQYICLDKVFQKHPDQTDTLFSRNTVMKSPEWFEEVTTIYIPKRLKTKVTAIVKKLK